MEGPTSKKTKKKEPPKRANHKGNIKFPTYTRADPTPTQAFANSQCPIIEPSLLRAYYVLFLG
jgi:hypothetical protein